MNPIRDELLALTWKALAVILALVVVGIGVWRVWFR